MFICSGAYLIFDYIVSENNKKEEPIIRLHGDCLSSLKKLEVIEKNPQIHLCMALFTYLPRQ